ncbi:uncharacterized protein N7515_001568 [Penicillium bovifimosum]|uniref:Uncharacterized protein n=1 Tax=Penicillium bovifimosum TaxID=126998 RepID=A0A9W9H9X4_9EURO|nr:uncharacterized protein N7515_001568 [Penicillium bovifimosum]KAJ5142781.1 hypothetical protein N7515_001568 [Penicillium bovifimosum]
MWSTLSSLLALPLLCLISLPLILSAWITISLAFFALVLRLSIVYLELAFGLIKHFFSIPTSSTSSLLAFTASEPPTPATGRSRRNSSQPALHPHKTHNDTLTSWALTNQPDPTRKKTYAKSMIEAHNLTSTPGFPRLPISGDERRDFEGVGGWRSYKRKAKSLREKPDFSVSSSSTRSTSADVDEDAEAEADERAWLSLNHRLELPSQLVTLGTSQHASSRNSPDTDSRANFPEHQQRDARSAQRHHHRSLTTSSLMTSDRRTGTGLSLALSTRPDSAGLRGQRLAAPFMTPQPYGMFSASQRGPVRAFAATGALSTGFHVSGCGDGMGYGSGGGYFALRRPGSSSQVGSRRGSPSASGYTTPGAGLSGEERDASSLGLARLMAHYPTSPRHRRQSISGPNLRGGGAWWELMRVVPFSFLGLQEPAHMIRKRGMI